MSLRTHIIRILLEKWRKAQSPPLKQLLSQCKNQTRYGHHHHDRLNLFEFCTDFNHLINKMVTRRKDLKKRGQDPPIFLGICFPYCGSHTFTVRNSCELLCLPQGFEEKCPQLRTTVLHTHTHTHPSLTYPSVQNQECKHPQGGQGSGRHCLFPLVPTERAQQVAPGRSKSWGIPAWLSGNPAAPQL